MITSKQIDTWPLVPETSALRVTLRASLEAGKMLQKGFYSDFESHVKEDQSEFTPFDEQAELIVRRHIRKFDPGFATNVLGQKWQPSFFWWGNYRHKNYPTEILNRIRRRFSEAFSRNQVQMPSN